MMLAIVMAGCSPTRHVPEGTLLLDRVKVHVEDSTGTLNEQMLMPYVHQRPNNRIFHITRLRLGLYNMSGNDSTKWWNRWIRRLGEAPVLYDAGATHSDSLQLLKTMRNAGFLKARVEVDSTPNHEKRKISLNYRLKAGTPHIIRSISYEFPNDSIEESVMRDSNRFQVKPGQRLDRNLLESQREWITERLQRHGYWAFTKEFITFNADTTEGSNLVDLTMIVHPPYPKETRKIDIDTHKRYLVRNVTYITDYQNSGEVRLNQYQSRDTLHYRGLTILYGDKKYLRPSVLAENCFILPGEAYNIRDVNNTYSAIGRLPIIKFCEIRMVPAGELGDTGLLDAFILLTPGKSQTISVELEGTNSEGDLGVALGLNYSHRNAGKGSETLNFKLRGSYEALNGNLDGFIHNRFMEYGAEASVTYPKFKAPLLHESFKRKIKASTELHLSLNYQERPEFTRIISTAGWSYRWSEHNSRYRYIFTPIDVNYVYLPKSTNDFIDKIAPDNPLLRYSYEDHFIMRAGFNFYYTNKRRNNPFSTRGRQDDIITVRTQWEVAGNVLFALSSIFNHRSDFHDRPYRIFGIRYSQYFRGDGDFTWLHSFDRRNALACYVGAGIGVPYGNSTILPFEKRFYGGGANGVRGWDVRTLGPGRFPGTNSVSDFIYQCGDIRFNLSAEYRAKLFWVVEGALFVDAGNVWTIRNYESQPYGQFRLKSFYKELAAAYGIGIRLDFNYFLVRFDLGMKAHNPAMGADPWPLIHPRWHRDHSLHFSIGYPF